MVAQVQTLQAENELTRQTIASLEDEGNTQVMDLFTEGQWHRECAEALSHQFDHCRKNVGAIKLHTL